MTGIQALERAAPALPMKPGHVERREFEYVRHGTQCLIAAFDVANGKVLGTIGESRTEADYVTFLEGLFATAGSTATWHAMCDNLNTHLSEGVVRPGLHKRIVAQIDGGMIPVVEPDASLKDKRKGRTLSWREASISLAHGKGSRTQIYSLPLRRRGVAGSRAVWRRRGENS